jgi:hypothetical protein
MYYLVKIWKSEDFKREIVYSADNDIQAIQMASAATPDGCRSTFEEITKEIYEKSFETSIQQEVKETTES